MFRNNPSLYLELDYLDTSNVTDMSHMFRVIQKQLHYLTPVFYQDNNMNAYVLRSQALV